MSKFEPRFMGVIELCTLVLKTLKLHSPFLDPPKCTINQDTGDSATPTRLINAKETWIGSGSTTSTACKHVEWISWSDADFTLPYFTSWKSDSSYLSLK